MLITHLATSHIGTQAETFSKLYKQTIQCIQGSSKCYLQTFLIV